MAPRRRVIMPGSAARVSRIGARTCTPMSLSAKVGSSSAKRPSPPKPALLTSRSMRSSSRRRSATSCSWAGSVRSAASTSTVAPDSACRRFAMASRRSRRRATMTRSRPSCASRAASAAPMPDDAPVTSPTLRCASILGLLERAAGTSPRRSFDAVYPAGTATLAPDEVQCRRERTSRPPLRTASGTQRSVVVPTLFTNRNCRRSPSSSQALLRNADESIGWAWPQDGGRHHDQHVTSGSSR